MQTAVLRMKSFWECSAEASSSHLNTRNFNLFQNLLTNGGFCDIILTLTSRKRSSVGQSTCLTCRGSVVRAHPFPPKKRRMSLRHPSLFLVKPWLAFQAKPLKACFHKACAEILMLCIKTHPFVKHPRGASFCFLRPRARKKRDFLQESKVYILFTIYFLWQKSLYYCRKNAKNISFGTIFLLTNLIIYCIIIAYAIF